MALPVYTPKSPLEELSIGRFSGRTYLQETVISVGTSRTRLIPNNPSRIQWACINEGANDVRLSTFPNITIASGWLLMANGGQISMFWEEDGEAVGYEVYSIANAAPANVRVLEVIRE